MSRHIRGNVTSGGFRTDISGADTSGSKEAVFAADLSTWDGLLLILPGLLLICHRVSVSLKFCTLFANK